MLVVVSDYMIIASDAVHFCFQGFQSSASAKVRQKKDFDRTLSEKKTPGVPAASFLIWNMAWLWKMYGMIFRISIS